MDACSASQLLWLEQLQDTSQPGAALVFGVFGPQEGQAHKRGISPDSPHPHGVRLGSGGVLHAVCVFRLYRIEGCLSCPGAALLA